MHNRNLSEMLPYEKLAVLGIDREKADSLPADVKEKLASGEVTPLLQVSIRAQNGDVITLPLKLQLTTDQQGNPALLAYPVRAALERNATRRCFSLIRRWNGWVRERLSGRRWRFVAKRRSSTFSWTPRRSRLSTEG